MLCRDVIYIFYSFLCFVLFFFTAKQKPHRLDACVCFQHHQGRSYLLVIEVMETIFKFIVPALCALAQPLQHLQKSECTFKE